MVTLSVFVNTVFFSNSFVFISSNTSLRKSDVSSKSLFSSDSSSCFKLLLFKKLCSSIILVWQTFFCELIKVSKLSSVSLTFSLYTNSANLKFNLNVFLNMLSDSITILRSKSVSIL